MNRFLTFHIHGTSGNEARMAPSAYYLEADCSLSAVRIYAEDAPVRDAHFDIFDDGTTIFINSASTSYDRTSGVRTVGTALTTAVLSAGENAAEIAGDFVQETIESDSWVYCNLVDAGGGRNFTVQLELAELTGE